MKHCPSIRPAWRPGLWRRAVAVLAPVLLLAACAGRPEGFLVPQGKGNALTSKVNVLVATTRMADRKRKGVLFSGERGNGLSFADIAVSIPPDRARKIGEVQWPSRIPANPAKEFTTISAERLNLEQGLVRFHQRLKTTPHRRVLVFVHGYNTRFEEAVFRLAQIVHDSRAEVVPVLFTWPSRGELLAYAYDRESSNYSRDALERVLAAMAKDPAVGEISILAHSMGNWVTLEALRQMAIRNGHIAPKIRQVMLAAPDVDVDVFSRQIAIIGDKRPPFTLFVSRDDRALAVSRRVWGSTQRVGAIDPSKEPYRTQLMQARINVFDLTKLKAGDATNHTKFAESPRVVRLIGQRLIAGQSLSDNKAGLGESIGAVAAGAASAVGSAAGLAVSAPLAIVDGRTRQSLGSQARRLGGDIAGTVEAVGGAVPRK